LDSEDGAGAPPEDTWAIELGSLSFTSSLVHDVRSVMNITPGRKYILDIAFILSNVLQFIKIQG
jgi:hypothetical protein